MSCNGVIRSTQNGWKWYSTRSFGWYMLVVLEFVMFVYLNAHIVSGSYSRFSFCYVGFPSNTEFAHRWCEFLKILFYKNCFCWKMKLMSYSRELQKFFHYTTGVQCLLLCFHTNESTSHHLAEHFMLLHGKCFRHVHIFSVNISTCWPWHDIVVFDMMPKT